MTPDDITRLAGGIIRSVAELPDRNSPEGWPEAMIVTGEELRMIITEALSEQQGKAGGLLPKVRDADIAAWVDRHDLAASLHGIDARCAFEDAQSTHLIAIPPVDPPDAREGVRDTGLVVNSQMLERARKAYSNSCGIGCVKAAMFAALKAALAPSKKQEGACNG